MKPKGFVWLMGAAIVVYALLAGFQGVAIAGHGFSTGSSVEILLGIAILVPPLVGVGLVWREVVFGRQCEALADALAAKGELPLDDLPKRPSGRVEREAADAWFEREGAAVEGLDESDPAAVGAWYRLSLAYDAAGDRPRARAAARYAIELGRSQGVL